jgi:WD40 repeat protein
MSGEAAERTDQTDQVDQEQPWPGLLPFREADKERFFGRSAQTEALLRLVLRERLTVLFGMSGLGKTSLLQAGLVPRLREREVFPVTIRFAWHDPAGLSAQVRQILERQAAEAGIEMPPERPGETLWELFHRREEHFWNHENRIVAPLLIFDQFEEIFTHGAQRRDEVRAFIRELGDLVEGRIPEEVRKRGDQDPTVSEGFDYDRHHYKVLVSLREDYLAALEGLTGEIRSLALHRFHLRRMNGRDALEAVLGPGGHLLDETVARKIVLFVAGEEEEEPGAPGKPPEAVDLDDLADLKIEPALLSVFCRELNKKRIESGASKIDAGLLAGDRTKILAGFYERSLAGMGPQVRRFIEESLLTVSGDRNSVPWDNAVNTPGITPEVLEELQNRRLLRIEELERRKWIELTHDRLTGVIRSSREARRKREEQQEVEARLLKADRVARRNLWIAIAMAALLVGVVVLGAGYRLAHEKADREQEQRLAAQRRAEVAEEGKRMALARSAARGALALPQAGRAAEALAVVAQAARENRADPELRALLVNLLLTRSWPLPLLSVQSEKALNGAELSPDGRLLVTASWDGTARLWDAASGEPGAVLKPGDVVNSASFSPQGDRVVTATAGGAVQVWDVRSGRAAGSPLPHPRAVLSARFGPEGRQIVTACADGKARLWDAASGKLLLTVDHGRAVNAAELGPDGKRILTASDDRTARLWNSKTGRPAGPPMRHKSEVCAARFSRTGRRVITGAKDGTVQIWTVQGRGPSLALAPPHRGAVYAAALSPDEQWAVTASEDGTARVWRTATGEPFGEPVRHGLAVRSAAFSSDGGRIVTASWDGRAALWQLPAAASPALDLPTGTRLGSAHFSPDGQLAVTAGLSDDPDVTAPALVWDARTGQRLGVPLVHTARIRSARFSPDSSRVLTASDDKTAQLWDARTGRKIGEPLRHDGPVASAEFSRTGRWIVTASEDRTARLWDGRTGAPAAVPPLKHRDLVMSARFSRDESLVITASDDGEAQLWSTATGQPEGPPLRHGTVPVRLAEIGSDGRTALTAAGNKAYVWEIPGGRLIGTVAHPENVTFAELSPHGDRFVTTSEDGAAREWDAATAQLLCELRPDPARGQTKIVAARFDPSGERIATAADSGAVQLWSAESGDPLGSPFEQDSEVLWLEFSPRGDHLVTAAGDGTARIWAVPAGGPDDTGRLADLAEAVGGFRIVGGALVPNQQAVETVKRLRAETAAPQSGEPAITAFLRWFLAGPADRPRLP